MENTHLKEIPKSLEQIRDTARLVTTTEIEFLRVYEELLYLYVKRLEDNRELRRAALEVLEAINKAQMGKIKESHF